MGKITDIVTAWDTQNKDKILSEWAARTRSEKISSEREAKFAEADLVAAEREAGVYAQALVTGGIKYADTLAREGAAQRQQTTAQGNSYRDAVSQEMREEKQSVKEYCNRVRTESKVRTAVLQKEADGIQPVMTGASLESTLLLQKKEENLVDSAIEDSKSWRESMLTEQDGYRKGVIESSHAERTQITSTNFAQLTSLTETSKTYHTNTNSESTAYLSKLKTVQEATRKKTAEEAAEARDTTLGRMVQQREQMAEAQKGQFASIESEVKSYTEAMQQNQAKERQQMEAASSNWIQEQKEELDEYLEEITEENTAYRSETMSHEEEERVRRKSGEDEWCKNMREDNKKWRTSRPNTRQNTPAFGGGSMGTGDLDAESRPPEGGGIAGDDQES